MQRPCEPASIVKIPKPDSIHLTMDCAGLYLIWYSTLVHVGDLRTPSSEQEP